MYSSAASHQFGGLDLTSSPDESACVDCLNVDFDRVGAVRVRDGFDNFTSSAATDRYFALAPHPAYSQLLSVFGDGSSTGTIRAINASGASVATQAIAATYPPTRASFVRFAAPGNSYMYIATSTSAAGADTSFYRWNGTAFAAVNPANLGNPAMLGLTPTDNRLAVNDTASDQSRIAFSDPGAPETFTANNYVDLHPGDGELVQAMVTWREFLIVFKESKFFVFYGNTTDSAGNPVFNYRPVVGAGCVGSRAFAVAPEGVYFCARDGIYVTTGGVAARISDPIEPIFTGATNSFFQSSALNAAQTALVAMTYLNGRVYLSYPSGSATANDRTLVYDTKTQRWTIWNVPASALSTFRISTRDELVFAYASGSNHIGRQNSTYTDDDGTAIVSRYRSGFSDLGTDEEKSIAKAELWGTGTVNYQLSKDFGSLDTATSVAMGTSPAIARGRAAERGGDAATLFSWQVGASSGAWTLHRLVHRVQSKSLPGQKTP